MAPRRRETTTIIETRRITRSVYKKQQQIEEKPDKIIALTTTTFILDPASAEEVQGDPDVNSLARVEAGKKEDDYSYNCSTPKSKKNKIPEIKTCPPAPKKETRRRSPIWLNIQKRRRPITFFTHPDVDKFFTTIASATLRDRHIKV